jgi:hypothetical protein
LIIRDESKSDLFEENDILAMFNENTYNITGSHSFDGETIVYTTKINDTQWTKTIEKYDLTGLTQDVEDEMSYWLQRVTSSIQITMELPFHSSGNEQKTEIDFLRDQHLEVTINHAHENMIRTINSLDENPKKRYTHEERKSGAYQNLALDRLIDGGWELPAFSNTWSSFWETEVTP